MQSYRKPINGLFRPGSHAERIAHTRNGRVLASSFNPTPEHDLIRHQGKTIQNLTYVNFYVGADKWQQSDIDKIDKTLADAMTDASLNDIISQYFRHQPVVCTFKGSHKLSDNAPAQMTQSSAENLIKQLHSQSQLDGVDLSSTVFNLLLPSGTILTLDDQNAEKHDTTTPHTDIHRKQTIKEHGTEAGLKKSEGGPSTEVEETSTSVEGLAGFHDSIHIGNDTIYYAIGVFSEVLPNGRQNGILAFDQPWKNIVATFYHELQEARTDPDVGDENEKGSRALGWVSAFGEEVGDFPVFEARPLLKVFKEVQLANGIGRVPIQLMYSNRVHGPESPIV